MTTAQRITARMAATDRKRSKDSIYSVVSDDHAVLCHTEGTLDAWWNSLAPEDKAALYELHLDGITEHPGLRVTLNATSLAEVITVGERALDTMRKVAAEPVLRPLCTNAISGIQPARGVKANA